MYFWFQLKVSSGPLGIDRGRHCDDVIYLCWIQAYELNNELGAM